MITLALVLVACGASADPMVERAPSSFSLPTIAGDPAERGSPAHGMLTVKSDPVSQTLSWEPVAGDLADTARHEIELIARAAEGAVDPTLVDAQVAGRAARSWEVAVEQTTFAGTAFDCPDTRVVLVTMGPQPRRVRKVHARSLAGAACP